MQDFKPNDRRARLAILFSWIVIGLEALSLISSILQYGLLQSWLDGIPYDEAAATANDLREGIVGIFVGVAYIAWIVFFLMWFYRARANLQIRLAYPLSCKPGLAVGYFFIPILNFYRPYQVVKELYVDTRELFVKDGLSETTALKTNYIGWWWALWLLSGMIENFVLRATFRGVETIEELISVTGAQMICSGLNILLALITIIVIGDYSRVEPMLETMGGEETE